MTATTETPTTAVDLEALRLPELRALFESATGEPARSPNKKYLARRVREAQAAAPTPAPDADANTAAPTEGPEVIAAAPAEGAELIATAEDHPTAPADAQLAAPDAVQGGQVIASTDDRPAPADGPTIAAPTDASANDAEIAHTAAPDAPTANDEEIARRYVAGELKPRALTIPQLRAAYRLAVGRDTQSLDRRYLQWRTREALKGNGPVGPLPRRAAADVEHKVLPLRMPAPAVEAMDAAAKRLGYATRIAFLRAAVAALLRAEGEGEAAEVIAAG